MNTVVIAAGAVGSRALVRAADSAARQTAGAEIVVVLSRTSPAPGVSQSIVQRVGAVEARAETEAAAINAGVERASGELLLILHAPWRLAPTMLQHAAARLDADPDEGVVVPALRVHSPDGRLLRTASVQPALPELLARPLATPPAFVIRRRTWEMLGPLEEAFGSLAASEWWLRLLSAGVRVGSLEDPAVLLEASGRDWWPPVSDSSLDLSAYRAVLEKHRALLDGQMTRLVVDLEIASARLIAEHRGALRERDRHRAELERVRAETAHLHAYLEHHGKGAVDWGDFRRVDPISRDWGYDRGTPIDRRYIDEFLAGRSSDVSGDVLEVQEDDFTRRFGGPRVSRSEVVDLDDSNPRATIVTDLRAAAGVDGSRFDCIILTQTLHVIADMPAVLGECWRLLKPGGILLATLPCASRVCLEYGEDGDLWRVTPAGARALFEPVFGQANVEIAAYGSVLTNVAFLHGLACSELNDAEFAAADPYNPAVVGVRARKCPVAARRSSSGDRHGAVLLYHRVDDQPDVHDLTVSAGLFAEQIAWLAAECTIVPLDRLLQDAPDALPERAVAITFDDGYLDTLKVAAPLLERMGVPATVFATSRWLESAGEYWWDILERILLDGDTAAELTIEIGEESLAFSTDTIEKRRVAHDRLHARLVHATLDARDRAVSQLVRWSGRALDSRRRPLLADELQQLARIPGMSVGAHTVNHLALPDQTPSVQRQEIVEGGRTLERVLGRRVDTFAYPYGAIDRASADLARANCRWSFSCDTGPVGTWFDAARVPRLEVKRWDTATLGSRLEPIFGAE